ncbi:hypothetical protein L218DRAFT_983785 [Marasmius fiardii PR-910]|nr:hypothetical protein L218DRAFT_983785 [Marasmius fiardii PR-910]
MMEEPSIIDDEIIADSEGEEEYSMPSQREMMKNQSLTTSRVSQFTDNPKQTHGDPKISSFTPQHANDSSIMDASTSASTGSSSSRPRPRPKPAYKGAPGYQPDSSNSHKSSDTSERSISIPMSALHNVGDDILAFVAPSIADRAKMRQRDPQKPKQLIPPIEVIDLSSDDDDFDELALTSSKKKSQKSKAKAKEKDKEKDKSSSSEARTKANTKVDKNDKNGKNTKKNKKTPTLPPILPPQEESSQHSLPMGTSPILPRIELAPVPPSTFPSSGPPQSTPLNILENGNENALPPPPIVLMPQLQLQSDIGSSSRATSPCPSKKRKRSSEQDNLEIQDAGMDIRMVTDALQVDQLSPKEASSSKRKNAAKAKKGKGKKAEASGSSAWDGDEGGLKKEKGGKASKGKKSKDKQKAKAKEPEFIDVDDLFGDELELPDKSTSEKASTSPHRETEGKSTDQEEVASAPPRKRQKTSRDNNAGSESSKDSSAKPKRRRKAVLSEDEEDDDGRMVEDDVLMSKDDSCDRSEKGKTKARGQTETTEQQSPLCPVDNHVPPKENLDPKATTAAETPNKPTNQAHTSISSRYSIAPRTRSTPMTELIRRVNAQPNSPFYSPSRSASSTMGGTAYSPYLKSSRSMLSQIAPLHPNRRTPPPPPPPPPPKKKSKKELEMEERWEEELVESVGGITEWAALSDQDRKDMRRAKREREMYGWED